MGSLIVYAIKSSITLALLYLPYTLLMRRDTLFRFNRTVLLGIVVLSLVVPTLDVPTPFPSSPVGEVIEQVRVLPTLIVTAGPHQGSPLNDEPLPLRAGWAGALILLGMFVVLLWKAVGLVRLLHFIPRGCLWTDRQDGATIYCHAGHVSPFSWMRSIVISPLPSSPMGNAILEHEMAHVRLGHSWDVLLISLVEALQWFNPCIWMLDASLREVHEYEADDAVLRRGISAREYQLLLIEKAVAGSRYPMVNGFNHSLLKNRITMMTKPKTNRWARLKVLYAVPLTLIALGAFASGKIDEKVKPLTFVNNKRVTEAEVKQLDQKKIKSVDVLHAESATKLFGEEGKDGAVLIRTEEKNPIHVKNGTLRLVVDGKEMTEQEAVKAVEGKKIKNAVSMQSNGTVILTTTTADDDPVVEKPEVLPEFPGGTNNFWGWLQKEIKYPKQALEYGVQGRIHVEFVVEKDGSITNIREISGPGGRGIVVTAYKAKDDSPAEVRKENEEKGQVAMQEEAKRVVKAMPRWTPGRDKGKTVRTKFVLPIIFRLS